MKGPQRLLEGDATEIERSLLRAGLDDRPSIEWMRETRAALGLATGVAAASTIASTAAAAKWGTPAALKWFAALMATTMVVGSAAVIAQRSAPPAATPGPELRDQVTSTASQTVSASAPAVEEATPQESPATAPPRTERAGGAPKTLSAEVASLDGVKHFLVADNPAAALNALAKYHFYFPTPMLGPEATVLEVQALMAAGDAAHRARAIALARRFVKMHPTSPHASQLEMLISKAREP
jgi:hypothetical protein